MSTGVFSEPLARPQNDWRRYVAHSPRLEFLRNALAFFIPMLIFIEIELIGRLFLSEILLLCLLPFLLKTHRHLLLTPLPKKVLLFGFFWLLSQIFTDVIRDTPFEDWSRGWSKIIFLLLNFSAIYLYLYGREKRFIFFAAGIAFGQILNYFLTPDLYAENYPWKFGYGFAVTLFAILASQTRIFSGTIFWPSAIILCVGVLNFYMEFRSLGLISLLTGGFVLVKQSNVFGFNKIKRSKVLLLIFLGSISIYGIYSFYNYAASEGWFGNDARTKYLMQSSGDFGVLLGGRSEILASVQAVIDSPIIGHGSWAKDWKYVDIRRAALIQNGYLDPGNLESGLIPSHSYIMGAWVEAGFVGAIFWFWALVLSASILIPVQSNYLSMTPLIAFVGFGLLWNIPFSPFGAEGRLYVAYYLALVVFILSTSRAPRKKKKKPIRLSR